MVTESTEMQGDGSDMSGTASAIAGLAEIDNSAAAGPDVASGVLTETIAP